MKFVVLFIVGLFLADLVFIYSVGQRLIGDPSNDEVARFADPSKRTDAVICEWNGGVTENFAYEVHIVEHFAPVQCGKDFAVILYAATRNENAYGVNLRWVANNSVHVEYLEAKWIKVRAPIAVLNHSRIKLVLKEGVADLSAPHGGMLYNLRGKPRDAEH